MQKLDPKAVWIFFLSNLFGWIFTVFFLGIVAVPLLLEGFVIPTSVSGLVFLVVALLVIAVIISYVWAKLTYDNYKYELTDVGFRKESGVIWKRYVTIPYSRIQNVDIYRGILARILGLSDLHIQTAGASAVVTQYAAGGMGSEGRLAALSKDVAEKLRDELVNRARPGGQGM